MPINSAKLTSPTWASTEEMQTINLLLWAHGHESCLVIWCKFILNLHIWIWTVTFSLQQQAFINDLPDFLFLFWICTLKSLDDLGIGHSTIQEKKKKKFSSPTPNSINKQEFWLSICVTWRKKKNKILEHVSWRSLETQHYCIVDCNKNQPYLNCDFSIICIQVIFTNSLSTVCGCLICSWNELKTNSMLAMT